MSRRWDAGAYDRVSDPLVRMGNDVVGRLELRGDETVIDAGCGTGRVTEQLLERLPAGRVIALDVSAPMLAEAAAAAARPIRSPALGAAPQRPSRPPSPGRRARTLRQPPKLSAALTLSALQ